MSMDKRIVGIILLLYSLTLIFIRFNEGNPSTLLWVTHLGLFLATIGFLLRNNFLLSTSLVAVIFYHILWALDFVISFVFGGNFLQMTGYLHSVSPLNFLFTLHHLWLSPLLLIVLYRDRKFHDFAWVGATGIMIIAGILTFLLTKQNINCIHEICSPFTQTPLASAPLPLYLLFLLILNTALYYLINSLLREWIK